MEGRNFVANLSADRMIVDYLTKTVGSIKNSVCARGYRLQLEKFYDGLHRL